MEGSHTVHLGIVVATFGSGEWDHLGRETLNSLQSQSRQPAELVHVHSTNLSEARNTGADVLGTEWVCFLDADDRLDPSFCERLEGDWEGYDIVQPSTRGVYEDGEKDETAVLIPARDLRTSNYLIVGSPCRLSKFHEAGGFDPALPVLEDWDLWRRMWAKGAVIGCCPDAVYEVTVRPGSRNTNVELHNHYYNEIIRRSLV
jgi:glycosyltransferase involved in cell wall biosynthesis